MDGKQLLIHVYILPQGSYLKILLSILLKLVQSSLSGLYIRWYVGATIPEFPVFATSKQDDKEFWDL